MVGFAADLERDTVTAARHARAVEVGRGFAEIVRDKPFVREGAANLDGPGLVT